MSFQLVKESSPSDLIESKLGIQFRNFRLKNHPALNDLSEMDKQKFECFGFAEAADIPFDKIHHAIEYMANAFPEQVAVNHLGGTITYSELDRQADFLANILMQHGVLPGECVGLYLRRSIPMVIGILAILKAGAAYVPQDVILAPENQLQYVSESAGIKVILSQSEYLSKISLLDDQTLLSIEECLDVYNEGDHVGVPRFPRSEKQGASPCFVIYTSGTTGKPNGAIVTHNNVCNLLLSEPGSLGIVPGDKVSQILNIAFDMAAWEVLGCLSHGGTLFIRGSDIEETVKQVDVVVSTPSVLGKIDHVKCYGVRAVAVAGEPCPKDLADRWSEFSDFYNCCGPTETTIVNTMQLYDPAIGELTIGTPTPNNSVYVLNEKMEPCRIGEVGEMWAGGACVTGGYINNAALSSERYKRDPFVDGEKLMFRTKDLGRWTSSGELEHLGRVDDQVKIKGFRVELDSVSTVLEKMDGCRQASTIKLDNDNLISFVCPPLLSEDSAKEQVSKFLPYYCVPSKIYFLESFPVTDRGKIDKRKLKDLACSFLVGVINVEGEVMS